MTSRWFADTKNLLITAHFFKKSSTFLTNCIQEKVIPTTISSVLFPSQYFPWLLEQYLVTSIHDLEFSEAHTFEKARLIGLELRRKQGISHNMAEQLISEISRINNNHISKLRSKFISLYKKSCWKDLGRSDLVNNISSISVNVVETEVKICQDLGKLIYINYRHHDSDFDGGFIQGIITVFANCHFDELNLPIRYITSFKSLSLLTTTSLFHPLAKVEVLLLWILRSITKNLWIYLVIKHLRTDIPTNCYNNDNINYFNKSYWKLISNEDNSWSSLINYHPIIPKNYRFHKTLKYDIPLRPIISEIGSAFSHNTAKLLAKLLSCLLGTISDAHIKDSGSLLNKLTDIDMNNKYLVSVDIKSLYTNIPVDRCIERLHNHLRKSNTKIPLPIS